MMRIMVFKDDHDSDDYDDYTDDNVWTIMVRNNGNDDDINDEK